MPRPDTPATRPAAKLLATPRVKVRLGLASALILGAGAWLAPRAAPTPLATPQEHVAPLLEAQVQTEAPRPPFRGVPEIASRTRAYGVGIAAARGFGLRLMSDFSERRPRADAGGFGVFVSKTHVLTHAGALDGRSSLQISTADGRTIAASVAAYEPSTGLVLLQTSSTEAAVPALAGASPTSGMLAVAVGRWEERDITVPLFVTSVDGERYTMDASHAAVRAGMPVYTLDGELLAVSARDGQAVHAYPAGDAVSRLVSRAQTGERRAAFGLMFQESTGRLIDAFGAAGVIINDVVAGSPADQAGIEPGDVLLAVGQVAVTGADAAAALNAARPGTPTELRVARNGSVRMVNVTPALAYEVAVLAQADADAPSTGPEARVVFPSGLLDTAGIPWTARILRVNGRRVSARADALREWRRGRQPVVLLLRHADRQFYATIEASR